MVEDYVEQVESRVNTQLACCFPHLPEDGGCTFFQNIDKHLSDNKVSCPERQQVFSMVAADRTTNITQRNILLYNTAADPKIPASDFDITFATYIGRNEVLSSGILVFR
jgi:hypothetical protein